MPYLVTDTLSGDTLHAKNTKEVYDAVDFFWPDEPLLDVQRSAKQDLLAEFDTWNDPESIASVPVTNDLLGAFISWIGGVPDE